MRGATRRRPSEPTRPEVPPGPCGGCFRRSQGSGPLNGVEENVTNGPIPASSARQREVEAHVAELVERVARDSIRREVFSELMEPNSETALGCTSEELMKMVKGLLRAAVEAKAKERLDNPNLTEVDREELQCQLDLAIAKARVIARTSQPLCLFPVRGGLAAGESYHNRLPTGVRRDGLSCKST